jgi:hypothetical protein
VSQLEQQNNPQARAPRDPNRLYILIAVVLVVIIVVAAILLITEGLPALRGEKEPTAVTEVESTATPVPTFTPSPTKEPTATPPPSSPTAAALTMQDTDTPAFVLENAGARPSVEWSGFFGQVLDSAGNPLVGVSVVVWYRDGQPAIPVVKTDKDGYYEIHLADAPLAGTWTIQLLTDGNQPASKLFTFQTDDNTETGIQQIQVVWKQVP